MSLTTLQYQFKIVPSHPKVNNPPQWKRRKPRCAAPAETPTGQFELGGLPSSAPLSGLAIEYRGLKELFTHQDIQDLAGARSNLVGIERLVAPSSIALNHYYEDASSEAHIAQRDRLLGKLATLQPAESLLLTLACVVLLGPVGPYSNDHIYRIAEVCLELMRIG